MPSRSSRSSLGSGLRHVAAGVVGLVLVLPGAGCALSKEVGGSNKPTPTTTPPPAEPGAVGQDVEFGGVLVTVLDITPFERSREDVPRIRVVMRTENVSSVVQDNPDVELLCDESSLAGDWFSGSTFEPNSTLPINVVSEGEVYIGFPLRGESPEYPVVTCTNARLHLTIHSTTSKQPRVVDVPIESSLIDETIRRPKGPQLPLPAADENDTNVG